jgi:hypothetical protein
MTGAVPRRAEAAPAWFRGHVVALAAATAAFVVGRPVGIGLAVVAVAVS